MSVGIEETKSLAALTVLRVPLPPDLLTYFEAQAMIAGLPDVESAIVRHLERTREYVEPDGLWMSAAEAREVRRLLGGRVNTGSKLVEMIRRLTGWKVSGAKVELSPARQESVAWWAKSMQLNVEDAIPKIIDMALGAFLKC